MQHNDERVALIALLLRSGCGWLELADRIMDAGDAHSVLRDVFDDAALFPVTEETPAASALAAAQVLLDACTTGAVDVRAFWEERYPAQLREIHEMPPVVFTRGRLVDDRRAVAVVGSRSASARGLQIAGNIAQRLVAKKVTVVSGLAAGIDTAAHRAALDAGGRTVAVIGTGINRYYPRENRALQDEIAEKGLLLSQFLPDSAPSRTSFPMRNAVMSGYAAATVVVEAGERSGARIQARYALKHGRRVVFTEELLANEWAKEFMRRPGVHVASGMDELMRIVDDVISETEMTAGDLVASGEAGALAW